MNTPYSIYEIDQRKKLNTLSDFENQKPTPIGAYWFLIPKLNPSLLFEFEVFQENGPRTYPRPGFG